MTNAAPLRLCPVCSRQDEHDHPLLNKAIAATLEAVRKELLPFIAAEEPLSIPLLDEDVIDAMLERARKRLE